MYLLHLLDIYKNTCVSKETTHKEFCPLASRFKAERAY